MMISMQKAMFAVILFAILSNATDETHLTSSSGEDVPRPSSLNRLQRFARKGTNKALCAMFSFGGLIGSMCTAGIMQSVHNMRGNQYGSSNSIEDFPIYRTSLTTTNLQNGMAAMPIIQVPQRPMKRYCPKPNIDVMKDGSGNVEFENNGWTLQGYGRVRGKTSFNLLGGMISFKMHIEGVQPAVNTNFYTVSPRIDDPSFFDSYCDIQEGNWESCMELDIVENNGNCKAQTTVHTVPLWGNPDCDRGGCAVLGNLWSGTFDVVAHWAEDGTMTVTMNGNHFNPPMTWKAKEILRDTMNTRGALLVSSQWTGWVPCDNCCPGGGNLAASTFTISDVEIQGRYVHGAEPTECD